MRVDYWGGGQRVCCPPPSKIIWEAWPPAPPPLFLRLCIERGAVVEWLETLAYGAESRRRSDDWKTLSVNPAVNGYLFRIREL